MNHKNPTGADTLPGGRALFPIASGWALDQVVVLDDVRPGFLATVCRARLLWRQALWACLAGGGATNGEIITRATGKPGWLSAGPTAVAEEFAIIVPMLSARHLVEATFGAAPDGLLGALRKLHGQPLADPALYRVLFDLYVSRASIDRKRRALLDQCPALDGSTIEALMAISDPAAVSPAVLSRFTSADDVRAFERDVAIVRRFCSWADDRRIREALAASQERRAQPWLISMISRADRLVPELHPCDADPDLERFSIGRARTIGKEFKNCLNPERIMPQAASGCWAMVLWRAREIIVETRLLDDGRWQLHRVHRAANKRVDLETLLLVRTKLEPLGVVCLLPAQPEPDLAGIGRASGGWDGPLLLGFDFWD